MARLIRIEHTPDCGILHLGATAEYSDLQVLNGIYPHRTIYVIHGCPELKRSEYGEDGGNLESFRAGDYHMLYLTKQNMYHVGTSFEGTPPENYYFCKKVDLYTK